MWAMAVGGTPIKPGKTLPAAGQEAGVSVKTYGPFPVTTPPQEIPDPDAFRQAVNFLKPGEMSPLVTGEKALYLLRLVSEKNPSAEEFEKDKAAFEMQLLTPAQEDPGLLRNHVSLHGLGHCERHRRTDGGKNPSCRACDRLDGVLTGRKAKRPQRGRSLRMRW